MTGRRPLPPLTTAPRRLSASVLLNQVVDWDGESPEIREVLITAFGADDYLDCIKDLPARGIDPVSYINSLDKARAHTISRMRVRILIVLEQVVDRLPADSYLQRQCIRALRKTCGIYRVLPNSCTIAFPLGKPGSRPWAGGRFSDTWKLNDGRGNGVVFAVKSLRVYEGDPVEQTDKVNKVRTFLGATGPER